MGKLLKINDKEILQAVREKGLITFREQKLDWELTPQEKLEDK